MYVYIRSQRFARVRPHGDQGPGTEVGVVHRYVGIGARERYPAVSGKLDIERVADIERLEYGFDLVKTVPPLSQDFEGKVDFGAGSGTQLF